MIVPITFFFNIRKVFGYFCAEIPFICDIFVSVPLLRCVFKASQMVNLITLQEVRKLGLTTDLGTNI